MVENKNMELWNKVCTTDPSLTKQINQRGGFTAICAQYQLRMATEIWGPYGSSWGIREIHWLYIGVCDAPKEIILTGEFYYPDGAFSISVDRPYKAGDEQRKKMLTDFRSKCLSTLGFNSDVFEGKFDDHAYVNSLKADKAKASKPTVKQSLTVEPPPDEEPDPTSNATAKQRTEIGKLAKTLHPEITDKVKLGEEIRDMIKAAQCDPDTLNIRQAGLFIASLKAMVARKGAK